MPLSVLFIIEYADKLLESLPCSRNVGAGRGDFLVAGLWQGFREKPGTAGK